MGKESETAAILEELHYKYKKKKRILIASFLLGFGIVIAGLLIMFFAYFYSPEKQIGIGAEIEKVAMSEKGDVLYVKLAGGTNEEEISGVKFVFNSDKEEYVYETDEGVKNISVPFKESFFDFLTKPNYRGVYDYKINSSEVGLKDFTKINKIEVIFKYKKGNKQEVETPVLDTKQTTTGGGSPKSSGGSSDSDGSDDGTTCTVKSCQDYYNSGSCGNGLSNNCGATINCLDCNSDSYCYQGQGTNNICINENITCIDSDNSDYFKKGNISIRNNNSTLFLEDLCSGNLSEFYCYYNGTGFEARNESYECGNGCEDGKCSLPQCTADENCTGISLNEIASCNNILDNNPFTWDYAPANISICLGGSCSAVTQTLIHTCNKTRCSAGCDSANSCLATECDNLDNCTGNNYYDYNDVANNCLNNCSCENKACGSPAISYNDVRCTGFCNVISECGDYTSLENCTSDVCNIGICEWNVTFGSCEEAPGECTTDADCVSRGPGFICNQTNSQCEWLPPIGIPKPTFGIEETYRMYDNPANRNPALTYYQNEEGGYYTHYVDNTNPNATDSNISAGVTDYTNPSNFGSLSKPRRTVPVNLLEGSVVEIHGGPYTYSTNGGAVILSGTGSASKPIFIRGFDPINKPQFTHQTYLGLDPDVYGWKAHYIVVENIDFYGAVDARDISFSILAPTHHAAVRNCEIHGVEAHSIGLYVHTPVEYIDRVAHNILVYGCKIHDLGHLDESEGDADYVGLFVADSNDVWIVDNEVFNAMGGIGIGQGQVGIPARRVYFGRNTVHDCLQAGMWCKWGEDIIFSQNDIYNMLISPNDDGHMGIGTSCAAGYQDGPYGPNRLWYIFNKMHDLHSRNAYIQGGIAVITSSSSPADPVYFIGNEIYNVDGHAGWQWNSGPKVYWIGNTIHNVGKGIYWDYGMPNGGGFYNNIISEVADSNYHLSIISGMDSINISNCIFNEPEGLSRLEWGGNNRTISQLQVETGKFAGCSDENPQFVDVANNNFNLNSSSPAIDSGIESEVYQRFYDLYGIDIRKDIEGRTRPLDGDNNGSAEWDIGAYEYNPDEGIGSSSLLSALLNFVKSFFIKEESSQSVTGNVVLGASSLNENSEDFLDSENFDLVGFKTEIKIIAEYFLKEILGVDVSVKNIGIGYVVKDTGKEDFLSMVFEMFL